MKNLKILNKKDKKELRDIMIKQWGADYLIEDAALKDPKGKIYLMSRDIAPIDFSHFNINNMGLYFGQLKNNELRLSIDGSQIVGPSAEKNIVELNSQGLYQWFQGYEVDVDMEGRGFVLMKYGDDFVGCGKLIDKRILNYVPKSRRVSLFRHTS